MSVIEESRKCQAKNPAVCRVHGVGFLTEKILKDISDAYQKGNYMEMSQDEFYKRMVGEEFDIDFVTKIVGKVKELVDGQEVTNFTRLEREVMNDFEYEEIKPYRHLPIVRDAIKTALWEKNKNLPYPKEGNELLIPMSSKEGYKFLLAKVVAKHGSPVSKGDNTYGWHDSDSYQHIYTCGVGYVTKSREETWSEWAGTFAEHDNYVQGIVGDGVCNCGGWRGVLRWEGSSSEAIRLAFENLQDIPKN